MTREEAKILAIPHKDKSKVVHVTADGNVFFEPQKADAQYHAKKAKIEIFSFNSETELISTEEQKAAAKAAKEAKKAAEEAKAAEAEAAAKAEEEVKAAEEAAKKSKPIENMKFGELVTYCAEKGYPEDEYKAYRSKDELIAYVQSK